MDWQGKASKIFITTIALLGVSPTFADQGSWVVRGMANNTQSTPLIEAANPMSRPQPSVSAKWDSIALDNFAFSLSYFVKDNVSVELLAARPIEQRVAISGLGSVGSLIQLPPTLTLRYHFDTGQKWEPYLGVGVNWVSGFDNADISGNTETDFSDSTTGYAFQAGVYVALSERWLVNFETRVSEIDLPVRVGGNPVGRSNINPVVTALKLGYQF